jgi:hypothetical protein
MIVKTIYTIANSPSLLRGTATFENNTVEINNTESVKIRFISISQINR